MSVFRNLLKPDSEGHYDPLAHELDRASQRAFAAGRHPLDPLANAMAREETRRRFFSRGAQGIGGLALASLLGGQTRAEGADCPGCLTSRPKPSAVSICIWWVRRRRWRPSTTSRR